jgi:hypothetical protein
MLRGGGIDDDDAMQNWMEEYCALGRMMQKKWMWKNHHPSQGEQLQQNPPFSKERGKEDSS